MYNADQNPNAGRGSDVPKHDTSPGDDDTDSTDSNREMFIHRNVKTSE